MKNLKLSKKKRHEVYRKALQCLRESTYGIKIHGWGRWEVDGICHAIMASSFKDIGSTDRIITSTTLPEFFLFEPESHPSFWFENKEEREAVLLICIEMTR